MTVIMRAYKSHTDDLFTGIHPALQQKYADMLNDWRREVSNRFTTANAVPRGMRLERTAAPVDKTGPLNDVERIYLIQHWESQSVKEMAQALLRSPASVYSHAVKLGLLRRRDLDDMR